MGIGLIDNVFRDSVLPTPGCVVWCDLVWALEHSGIYIGDNEIAHLNGDGEIEAVSPEEFINRRNGKNLAVSIYVSCFDKDPSGSKAIAKRAKSMIGKQRKYHLLADNCHQFTSGCITGDFETADNLFTFLMNTVDDHMTVNNWRVWTRNGHWFATAD